MYTGGFLYHIDNGFKATASTARIHVNRRGERVLRAGFTDNWVL